MCICGPSVAETPIIPAKFDVMADYNFSKVAPFPFILLFTLHGEIKNPQVIITVLFLMSLKLIVGVVHQYLRIAQLLHSHRELLLEGYYSYM